MKETQLNLYGINDPKKKKKKKEKLRSVAFYLFIVENVEDIHTHFALSASPCYSFEYLETLKRGCNKIENLWAH